MLKTRSMHNSDAAKHTIQALMYTREQNIKSVYVLINLTAKKTWRVAIYSNITALKSIGIL